MIRKTIERSKLSPISMSVHKNLPTIVNDNNKIYEYVGIGWINITDKYKGNIESLPKVKN